MQIKHIEIKRGEIQTCDNYASIKCIDKKTGLDAASNIIRECYYWLKDRFVLAF